MHTWIGRCFSRKQYLVHRFPFGLGSPLLLQLVADARLHKLFVGMAFFFMYVLQANSVKNRAGDLLKPRYSREPRVHTSFIPIGGIVLGWIMFGIWAQKMRHLLRMRGGRKYLRRRFWFLSHIHATKVPFCFSTT
jgi:hypothetical protein